MKGMLSAMLCQFTFKNYRSYRDEAELSMQATPMKEFERSLIECSDGQSFLPVAAVYGPNAGGKSNLLEALDYVRSAVADQLGCCPPALMHQRVIVHRYPVVLRSGSMTCLLPSPLSSSSTTALATTSTAMPCPYTPMRSCPKGCGGVNWERRVRRCCSSARVQRFRSVPRCASL